MVCTLIYEKNMWFLYSVARGYWKACELLKKSNLIEVKRENTTQTQI